ncbi:uncharacterized protein LOC106715738 [Papilio machaon]|uniref:uncharacterized protein LOC106715738 n=1 Tax=Papilio machaon TaxID=76193 RepID=UPI001E6658F4|nr:uncharacterized protein LOC106715738 [Papilio machaon]
MSSLVNTNYSRTYSPSGRQNALSDIKRLLTCRDTASQNKACGYLIEGINRYKVKSHEQTYIVEYFLDNDIIVFLCEAISNLDFSLFRSVLTCMRLLWTGKRFFEEEHAAHATAAVLRALTHYAAVGSNVAVEICLQFITDLFNGISLHKSASPLSHQSAYSVEQLLACLKAQVQYFSKNPSSILSSAKVLQALISYQPSDLKIRACVANSLVQILNPWLEMLVGALKHTLLVDGNGISGNLLVVTSQIGLDTLRLINLVQQSKQQTDFIQSIIIDEQELNILKDTVSLMTTGIQTTIYELALFVKENQIQITTEEYSVFLKFLLNFLQHDSNSGQLPEFCDMLFAKEYLTILPQIQIKRNDSTIRKLTTLVLGEFLKVLASKYLCVNDNDNKKMCAKDIYHGLVELQYGIENPQNLGQQLEKTRPYSLLIYIYFSSQSSDNPEEATAKLLPHLVKHILHLPATLKPPFYIIKALWLVFAMSTISNTSLKSLEERVYLEKATQRLILLLQPDPTVFYTHNPAILLWSFSSSRIPDYIRTEVLSQWLKTEDSLPEDMTKEFEVWKLLLNILIKCKNKEVVANCMETLNLCLEEADEESTHAFSTLIWSMLPEILSKYLIDYSYEIETNTCHLMDLATSLYPSEVDQNVCIKIAALLTAIFSRHNVDNPKERIEVRYHYEYVCLKLCLILLNLAHNRHDNRVLLIFTNREGFLPAVLYTSNHCDDRVSCVALQLLSYVVRYFTKNNYQPRYVLQVQTEQVIKSLRRDSAKERSALLLQFVCAMLSSVSTPLALSSELSTATSGNQQCKALRALMFRIQLSLCCRDSDEQRAVGWKTLTSIFKYAVLYKGDAKLVAVLTSQPWTHTLIRFQLTQKLTDEFLSFLSDWLTLLQITIQNSIAGT